MTNFVTTVNTIQEVKLVTVGGTSPAIALNNQIKGTGSTTVSISPQIYSLNAPLIYVNNISGVSVTVNNRVIVNNANVLFVRKSDNSYGLLDYSASLIMNTINSVI
jgi:hypothetical protein